jgi:HNH endonuclease
MAENSPPCSVTGCAKAAHTRGMCLMHYTRNLRHGDPTITLYGQPPIVERMDDHWRVDLAGRDWALFDEVDLPLVLAHRWRLSSGYAKTRIDTLHRLIMGRPKDLQVDHINRVRLDCRRANLRIATHQENVDNTTRDPLFGIERHGLGWRVVISRGGVRHRIGRLPSVESAVLARDELLLSL